MSNLITFTSDPILITQGMAGTVNLTYLWSLGGAEVFLILIIILLFFGAKRIPGLARGLGKGIREFKDAKDGVDEKKNTEKK